MKRFDFDGFRRDFKEAISELEKKYNLEVSLGNISYDSTSFSTKLSAVSLEGGADKYEVEFKKYCTIYGYTESDYKRKVKINGKIGEFIGFIPKGRKYRYLVKIGEDQYRTSEINFI